MEIIKDQESVRRDVKGRYVKGSVGNPSGRYGSRFTEVGKEMTRLLQEKLESEWPDFINKMIGWAKEGDANILKMMLDWCLIKPKDSFLPSIKTQSAKDLNRGMSKIIESLSKNEISLEEAKDIVSLLATKRDFIRGEEEETMLKEIDHALKHRNPTYRLNS